MRVLVTGGTGFIGANLVRHLLARGDEVRCVVRKPGVCLEGLDVRMVEAPLGDVEALASAMDGCEGVYHVAGLFDPSPGGRERMFDVHVYATRAILRAMEKAGVRRMVLCSSSVTVGFGPREAPGDEDAPLDDSTAYGRRGPLHDYFASKAQAEAMALGWRSVEAVVVNPDFTIGEWDVKPTSGRLIVEMAKRQLPFFPRGGKNFQDAADCAAGHALAMDRGVPGRRYLLGTENLSYREFLSVVAGVVGRSAPKRPMPLLLVEGLGLAGGLAQRLDGHRFAGLDAMVLRSMQVERYRSPARSWSELGVPRTPVATAVEKAYKWFRDHGYC